MARYRVLSWRGVPSLVEAVDDDGSAQVPLSSRFQELIDTLAMREGASDEDAYLEGWERGPEQSRAGRAEAVAAEVAAELEASFEALAAARLQPPHA
jgi:hypothetical protein